MGEGEQTQASRSVLAAVPRRCAAPSAAALLQIPAPPGHLSQPAVSDL